MPPAGYGVLAGAVVDQRAEGGADSPHYQVRVRGGEGDFRVAVNVLSQEQPAELLYVADENFRHPVTQSLPGLPDGALPRWTASPAGWRWTLSARTCSTGSRCSQSIVF